MFVLGVRMIGCDDMLVTRRINSWEPEKSVVGMTFKDRWIDGCDDICAIIFLLILIVIPVSMSVVCPGYNVCLYVLVRVDVESLYSYLVIGRFGLMWTSLSVGFWKKIFFCGWIRRAGDVLEWWKIEASVFWIGRSDVHTSGLLWVGVIEKNSSSVLSTSNMKVGKAKINFPSTANWEQPW